MPQGDKGSDTDKQKRKAAHIEEGYEKRGTPKKQAEARTWATVNKERGGGKKVGLRPRQGREPQRIVARRQGAQVRIVGAEVSSRAERMEDQTRKRQRVRLPTNGGPDHNGMTLMVRPIA